MREGGRRGRLARAEQAPPREVRYRQLAHPFAPQPVFSQDAVAAIHGTALDVLERLGVSVLLPEARDILRQAGAVVQDEMVRIGRDMVEAALASVPRTTRMRARDPAFDQSVAAGRLIFMAAGGCPNVSDARRGRRAGDLASYREVVRLCDSFDAIHMMPAAPEPQDVALPLRHYAQIEAQMTLGRKPVIVYARGRGQVQESFEMLRRGWALSEEDWQSGVWASTVINSNSPRCYDAPMAQGIIDFARAGQLVIVTPFCLAGAMAPVTLEGALTLQHAEALAGIVLSQMTAPGAPVIYGGFSSNVDLKSGAPAFGTPEHVRMQLGSGQLARHIGLPWRSASGSAANVADMQAATENMMGLWGAMLAGATVVVHAAGWLEGGLTFGYEKFICDLEAVQRLAELCLPVAPQGGEAVFAALEEVAPGGHFFAARDTMETYATAFYAPLNADLSAFGTWEAAGAQTAEMRATAIWEDRLARHVAPPWAGDVAERLGGWLEARRAAGGAPPEVG